MTESNELNGIINDLVGAPHTRGWYTPDQMRIMAKAIKALREDVTQMMTLADSRSETIAKQTESNQTLRATIDVLTHMEDWTPGEADVPRPPEDPVAAALTAEIEAAIKRAEDAGEHPLQEVTNAMKVQRTRIHDVVDILDNMTPDAFNILMGRK